MLAAGRLALFYSMWLADSVLVQHTTSAQGRQPSIKLPSLPFPSRPFPSLPFPSLPFPSLPFPSLAFPFAFLWTWLYSLCAQPHILEAAMTGAFVKQAAKTSHWFMSHSMSLTRDPWKIQLCIWRLQKVSVRDTCMVVNSKQLMYCRFWASLPRWAWRCKSALL